MPFPKNTYMVGIRSVADYSPFGVELDGRTASNSGYRYSFQGQEKDDEIKGEGNSINYKYRMHDPRIGRFFAVDPLAPKYPWNSVYAFSENRVIASIELEGLEAEDLYSPAGQQREDGSYNGFLLIDEMSATPRNAASLEAAREQLKVDKKTDPTAQERFLQVYKKFWENPESDQNVITNEYYDQKELEARWGNPLDYLTTKEKDNRVNRLNDKPEHTNDPAVDYPVDMGDQFDGFWSGSQVKFGTYYAPISLKPKIYPLKTIKFSTDTPLENPWIFSNKNLNLQTIGHYDTIKEWNLILEYRSSMFQRDPDSTDKIELYKKIDVDGKDTMFYKLNHRIK